MLIDAKNISEYLKQLPEDRRAAVTKVRSVVRKNLPKGIVEELCYGMISWVIPHKVYPPGYHCNPKQGLPYAGLASQKQYMSLYLMSVYQVPGMEGWLRDEFAARGKKLDMGKCCLRFKKLEDLPLDVVGEAIARVSVADFIMSYEDSRKVTKARR